MPTVYALTSDSKPTWLNASGDPASGYQLFVYEAGTTTKTTTYRDSDGAVANANPIVLDSRGEPGYGIYVVSGTYKLVLAPDTDTDPPASAVWTRDDITPINNVANATSDEWTASGLTPTYVSGTQFTLVGDQTTEFHEGRRLRITDSGGTDYGVITASSYTSLTTITVALDSGSIDSGISAVDYGILSADNSSAPHMKTDADGLALTGDLQIETGSLRQQQGSDVASAATLPINVDGNFFDVTGTTTITALASKGVGTMVVLQFDGALTITHDAANLVLPNSSNITTAAGDIAVFYEYASSDWRMVSYQLADAIVVTRPVAMAAQSTSSGTAKDFTSIPSWASHVLVAWNGVSTNGTTDEFQVQVGTSGSPTTSGYTCGVSAIGGADATSTSGMQVIVATTAAVTHHGRCELVHMEGDAWVGAHTDTNSSGVTFQGNSTVTLAGTLDNVRFGLNGSPTDAFDAGNVKVWYW